MHQLEVTPNLDLEPWDLDQEAVVEGLTERIGLLPGGMTTGRLAVLVSIRLADRQSVIGWTSWELWQQAQHRLVSSPAAQIDRLESMGIEALMTDLEATAYSKRAIEEYQARLRAEGVRSFAELLEAQPMPYPVHTSVCAAMARGHAEMLEAQAHD
ncbi:hypothetical protein [Nonomuraea soli]|uniref:Uncharacterized protein n=1 Tax=Nonomuraea soli TaxID=1032476 RepID=A0A7W0CUB2_9ACTN|nr:hypothetical protein [Nonomuraea soli]MBA2897375.1 hypothetical protein [Nonomuraea soli]